MVVLSHSMLCLVRHNVGFIRKTLLHPRAYLQASKDSLRGSTCILLRQVATSAAIAPRVGREVPQRQEVIQTNAGAFNDRRFVPRLGASGNRVRPVDGWSGADKLSKTNRSVSHAREYKSDLVVVLDMDECLIHSVFQSASEDFEQFRQYEIERANRLQQNPARRADAFEKAESTALYDDALDKEIQNEVETFHVTLPDGENVLVHQRPHLHTFLTEVCQSFETHIFTAAMPVYAKPVLDALEQKSSANLPLFSQRWYRDQCTVHQELGVYVKDLEKVLSCESLNNESGERYLESTYNPKRTVLIDNNPMSFFANPCNGILVSNFYDDPLDETLPAVLDLLRELDAMEDVRPRLNELFGLSNALSQIVSVGNHQGVRKPTQRAVYSAIQSQSRRRVNHASNESDDQLNAQIQI